MRTTKKKRRKPYHWEKKKLSLQLPKKLGEGASLSRRVRERKDVEPGEKCSGVKKKGKGGKGSGGGEKYHQRRTEQRKRGRKKDDLPGRKKKKGWR